MATSPTVLIGSPPPPAPALIPAPAKFPVVPLLIAVIVGVFIAALGLGSFVYYLVLPGKFPMQSGAANKTASVTPVTTHVLVLEPLLVNLSDEGSKSYLRLSLTLRIIDAAPKSGSKSKEENLKEDSNSNEVIAAVRDTTLMVLGRQTAEGLLAADGKAQLKAALKLALAKNNPNLKVMDIYFTDFLVQR